MAGQIVGYFRDGHGAASARRLSIAEQKRQFGEFCRAEGLEAGPCFIDPPERPDERSGVEQLLG